MQLTLVETFGMRTDKLHLNWVAMDKLWRPNNHERALLLSFIYSGLVSGERNGIEVIYQTREGVFHQLSKH